MDGEQRDVSPKDKPPEIQCDPVSASASSGKRQIQEVDGNRQQPKKQTNDQMFAPGGLHKASVVANSNSRTTSARTTKRFRSSRGASPIQIVHALKSLAETQPVP